MLYRNAPVSSFEARNRGVPIGFEAALLCFVSRFGELAVYELRLEDVVSTGSRASSLRK